MLRMPADTYRSSLSEPNRSDAVLSGRQTAKGEAFTAAPFFMPSLESVDGRKQLP